MQLEFHPLAELFPLIEGADFDELVADIKANGIHDPIDVYQGKVLDGRNRYRAAIAAGVEVEKHNVRHFRPELYGEPLSYVISKNLKRRHLNESQRALAAARISRLKQGARTDLSPIGEKSQAERAGIMNVGKRSVERADDVLDKGSPEIVRAVERGKLSISAAALAARNLTISQQARVAERAEAGDERAAQTVLKQETRAVRERELGERQIAAPEGKFGVIVEDFEWDYEVFSRDTGMDRHAANHYEVASDAHSPEEIVARTKDRFACADDHCVLFQWTTIPHLAIAIDVLRLRGFRYVSHYIWRKDRIITGWWLRARHEILLIGVKGKPPCPAPGTQLDSVIDAALGEHSAKPDAFMAMIEKYFPTLPKLELNARRARPGWTVWGNEAETSAVADASCADESGITEETTIAATPPPPPLVNVEGVER